MIEAKVISYLCECGFDAFAEEPAKKPKEYVVVRMVDASRTNHIDACSIYLECVSDSMLNAAKYCNDVKNKMYDFVSVDGISSCRLSGSGKNIDTQQKKYRYEAVFNIVYTD